MCAALLLPNCRDAFLRLSQLPSLRDRRFIRQSCLLRRKNASLQVFTEFTYNRIVKRASKRSNKSSVETWRAAPPLTRTEQTRECPSPAKRWTFFREGSKNYSSSVILEDFFVFIFAWSVNGTGFLLAKYLGDKSAVPWQLGVLRECPSLGRRWTRKTSRKSTPIQVPL